MQRTPTGKGYWMMTKDGRIFRFGDAKTYGNIAGCTNYGGAARMLVTPTGHGYWIATGNGNIVAFGDAKSLGFPATVGGPTIALHRREVARSDAIAVSLARDITPTGSSEDTGLRGWTAHARALPPTPRTCSG